MATLLPHLETHKPADRILRALGDYIRKRGRRQPRPLKRGGRRQ